jgi:hypothetical protein
VSTRRVALVAAAWGAGLAVLAALAPVWERDEVALVQLPLAVLATLLLAAGLLALRPRDVLEVPDASVGVPALGLGLTLLGVAAAVGLWPVFLAAPLLIVGVLALLQERGR